MELFIHVSGGKNTSGRRNNCSKPEAEMIDLERSGKGTSVASSSCGDS